MAQRDAHRAEQVVGTDGVGIPLTDFILRVAQLVRLAVGEMERLVFLGNAHLALGLHAIDGLVVNHTTVVLEEGAVFPRYINKHRRKAVFARAFRRPQGGGGTACIAVTRTATVAGIDWTQSAILPVVAGSDVVVQPVAQIESCVVATLHPVGRIVVGEG